MRLQKMSQGTLLPLTLEEDLGLSNLATKNDQRSSVRADDHSMCSGLCKALRQIDVLGDEKRLVRVVGRSCALCYIFWFRSVY